MLVDLGAVSSGKVLPPQMILSRRCGVDTKPHYDPSVTKERLDAHKTILRDKKFNAPEAGGSLLLHDPSHQLCWLYAQAVSDLYEFENLNASFARFNFPDKRIASPELGGQLALREISCFPCLDY